MCGIHYYNAITDYASADAKKAYLRDNKLMTLPFTHIIPDRRHNWIDQDETSWDDLIAVASKETKKTKQPTQETAIFKLFSLGVVTNRDEWVYDRDYAHLTQKVRFLIDVYNEDVTRLAGKKREEVARHVDYSIKWTRAVKNDLVKGKRYKFDESKIVESLYRPFTKQFLYFCQELNEMQYQNPIIFPNGNGENTIIAIDRSDKPFNVLASRYVVDLHFNGDAQCLPLYRYDKLGNRRDNITEWALQQFQSHYKDTTITRLDIFHYVYGVLHDPAYRTKYEINLKRDFPRIPFYSDFHQWAGWGKQLMDLHINYETAEPYLLERVDTPANPSHAIMRPRLKADKANNQIELDRVTTLRGVPPLAWTYKLGNRSALE